MLNSVPPGPGALYEAIAMHLETGPMFLVKTPLLLKMKRN